MPGHVVTFATVDELVTALRAAGIREVTTEPENMSLPGVLVRVRGVRFDLLAGSTLLLAVQCVDNGAAGVRRTMDTLAGLATACLTVIDPAADVVSGTVQLTETDAALPCLEIPVEMETSPL